MLDQLTGSNEAIAIAKWLLASVAGTTVFLWGFDKIQGFIGIVR